MALQRSRPWHGCRPGRLVVLAALAVHLAAPAAAASLLEAVAGRWATRSGPPVAMEWSPRGGGFDLRFNAPDGAEASATFAPAGRANLFFTERERGWSMFEAAPPNPMLDGPLAWARTTPDTILVYRLVIDEKGGFTLERFACEPKGEELQVAFQRRHAGGRIEEARLQLARVRS